MSTKDKGADSLATVNDMTYEILCSLDKAEYSDTEKAWILARVVRWAAVFGLAEEHAGIAYAWRRMRTLAIVIDDTAKEAEAS